MLLGKRAIGDTRARIIYDRPVGLKHVAAAGRLRAVPTILSAYFNASGVTGDPTELLILRPVPVKKKSQRPS